MTKTGQLSKAWKNLADAVGGMKELAAALNVSDTTLYKKTRGRLPFSDEQKEKIKTLAGRHDVPNPLTQTPKPWSKDLRPLVDLSNRLEMGFPIARRELRRLRETYPDDQLVKLAEAEGTPEKLLRAVQLLLEDA